MLSKVLQDDVRCKKLCKGLQDAVRVKNVE
jgi:hypothetical protein